MYEAHDAWPEAGINVLFADYHVERRQHDAVFKILLKGVEAKEPLDP